MKYGTRQTTRGYNIKQKTSDECGSKRTEPPRHALTHLATVNKGPGV
jgi:hypothetical protein